MTPEEFTGFVRAVANAFETLIASSTSLKRKINNGLNLANGAESYGVSVTPEMISAIVRVDGPEITRFITEILTAASQIPRM